MKNLKRRILAALLAAGMLLSAGCSEAAPDHQKVSGPSATTTTTKPVETTTKKPDEDKLFPVEKLPESDITPALWKIKTKSGKDIYFMGSMHALPKEAYSLPEVIMDAYNQSDAIAVECDVVAFEKNFAAQLALSQGLVYSDGTSIRDHISPELYNALVKKMKEWDIFTPSYDYMKPVAWQTFIEDYLGKKSEISAEYSFDSFFLKKAKSDKKRIIEVESVEAQMDVLFGFSDEVNELLLSSYLDYTRESYTEELRDLYETWASGDLERLNELLNEETDESLMTQEEILAMEEYDQRMIHSRNKVMADKLIELSKGDESVFYYVGLAHFVGDTGILALLDNAGVKYERVEYK